MSTYPQTAPPTRPEIAVEGELTDRRPAWVRLATSADHKDIGRILIGTSFGALFLALVELVLIRLQLSIPDNFFLDPVTYDRLLSVYGATSVFLFALPLVIGLAYYVVPLQIGSRGTALPRVGQIGMWLFILGGLLLYLSFVFTPPEAGINPLPPLSELAFTSNNGVDAWIASVGLAVLGLLFLTIDLLVTIRNLRAPGMAWRRVPLFTWAAAIASWLFFVAAPIFLAALVMLMIDRRLGGGFFTGGGGAPLLWQHLSYLFFSSAYVLVAVVALGAMAEIVQTFTRKPLPSRNAFLGSLVAIAVIGLLAWGQNLLNAPVGSAFKYFSMFMALALIVPFGIAFKTLISAVQHSDFNMTAPLRFSMGALSIASIGLLAEVGQSTIAVATQLQQTYDAWAATHFALAGFAIFGGLAAVTYWYPKMTGRKLNEDRAAKSFWVMFIGILIALGPLFAAGVEGQVTDSFRFFGGEGLSLFNLISLLGTLLFFLGTILAVGNLIRSRIEEPTAPPDPYRASTLEWLALSPPPAHNFDVLPDVRSDRPLDDIREILGDREASRNGHSREGEPVG